MKMSLNNINQFSSLNSTSIQNTSKVFFGKKIGQASDIKKAKGLLQDLYSKYSEQDAENRNFYKMNALVATLGAGALISHIMGMNPEITKAFTCATAETPIFAGIKLIEILWKKRA